MKKLTTLAQTDRVLYAKSDDVFAVFKDDSSVSIEEFPRGEITVAAKWAAHRVREDGDSALVLSLANDVVGGAHNDTVWFDPDEDARLEAIDRARIALDNAEAALLAVGYVDRVHLCTEDYMPVPKREHNAFLLGQDSRQSQQPA